MPGLGVRNTNKTFLGMFQGMMTRNVSEGTENAIKRIKKSGKEVYEIQFNTLEGYFTDIRVTQDDEGRKYWVFVMEWEGDTWELSTGYTSIAAKGVLVRLKNMDFSQLIEFRSYWIEGDDDVYRGFLTPYVNGNKIDEYYTREDPKEMPLQDKVIVNGAEQNDSTKRMEFFQNQVITEILPKMREAHPLSESAVNESEAAPEVDPFIDPQPETLTDEQRKENISKVVKDGTGHLIEDTGPGTDDDLPF